MEDYDAFLTRRAILTDPWPLASNIGPALALVVLYFLFTFAVGPTFMKNREPFKLKGALIVYNAAQVIFNLWLCSMVDLQKFLPQVVIAPCEQALEPDFELTLIKMSYWYFINKILDMMDTVFMVLRKKDSQLTLLHLYHHPSTLVYAWLYMKYGPGVLCVWPWYMNCALHVVMYTYYLLAGLGPEVQKYLFWKKYITAMQMAQLFAMGVYAVHGTICCELPFTVFILLVGNPIVLFVLFGQFYLRTYKSKKKLF